jgi:hypothetical protein
MDESLCTAIKDGLGMNERLESLDLKNIFLSDDNSDLWCRAFSFLRTNKALKSLSVDVYRAKEACVSAFYINIAAMLQENTSLERLFLQRHIKPENYLLLVTALAQHNSTLKSLNFDRAQKSDGTTMKANEWPRSSRRTMHWKVFPMLIRWEMWAPSYD